MRVSKTRSNEELAVEQRDHQDQEPGRPGRRSRSAPRAGRPAGRRRPAAPSPGRTSVIAISASARRNRTRAARSAADWSLLERWGKSPVAPMRGRGWLCDRQYHQSHPSQAGTTRRSRSATVPPGRFAVMSGEGPEYGWLYGGKGSPPEGDGEPDATRPIKRPERRSSEPPPDATRMMPTQPRPGATAAPRTTRPTPPPVAPPVDPGPPAGGGRGRRRPRFRLRYVFLILLAWLVYIVAVPILAWTNVEKVEFEPDGDRPSDQPGTTYLLVGSDSREGLTKEERKELNTGNAGRQPHRHDHAAAHRVRAQRAALAPPRLDRRHPRLRRATRSTRRTRSAARRCWSRRSRARPASGSTSTSRSGWAASRASSTRWAASRSARSATWSTSSPGCEIKKGCQEVDGATALAYARSRHTSGIGDIDRVRRQREVVSAVGEAGAVAVDDHQPGPLVAAQPRDPRVLHVRRGHGTDHRRQVGHGHDPGRRRQRA